MRRMVLLLIVIGCVLGVVASCRQRSRNRQVANDPAEPAVRSERADPEVTREAYIASHKKEYPQSLRDLLERKGVKLGSKHADCGLMMYDREKQDVHAGGSGCGCSASILCSYFLSKLEKKELNNLLFVATGALMSPTSSQQGESIPGIAHLIHLTST